jgi:hypothetical protein
VSQFDQFEFSAGAALAAPVARSTIIFADWFASRGLSTAWSLGDVQVIRVQDFADLLLDPFPCLSKAGKRANDARWLTIVSDHNLEIASSVWFDGVCAHRSIIGQSSIPTKGTNAN